MREKDGETFGSWERFGKEAEQGRPARVESVGPGGLYEWAPRSRRSEYQVEGTGPCAFKVGSGLLFVHAAEVGPRVGV